MNIDKNNAKRCLRFTREAEGDTSIAPEQLPYYQMAVLYQIAYQLERIADAYEESQK